MACMPSGTGGTCAWLVPAWQPDALGFGKQLARLRCHTGCMLCSVLEALGRLRMPCVRGLKSVYASTAEGSIAGSHRFKFDFAEASASVACAQLCHSKRLLAPTLSIASRSCSSSSQHAERRDGAQCDERSYILEACRPMPLPVWRNTCPFVFFAETVTSGHSLWLTGVQAFRGFVAPIALVDMIASTSASQSSTLRYKSCTCQVSKIWRVVCTLMSRCVDSLIDVVKVDTCVRQSGCTWRPPQSPTSIARTSCELCTRYCEGTMFGALCASQSIQTLVHRYRRLSIAHFSMLVNK